MLVALADSTTPDRISAADPPKGLDKDAVKIVTDNFKRIRDFLNCGMIIITHDLEFARTISDRIGIMYAGQIMELSSTLLAKPLHPYTKSFIRALPENGLEVVERKSYGCITNKLGCKYASRCLYCNSKYLNYRPELYSVYSDIQVRCFKYAGL